MTWDEQAQEQNIHKMVESCEVGGRWTITRGGETVAVVIPHDEYVALQAGLTHAND